MFFIGLLPSVSTEGIFFIQEDLVDPGQKTNLEFLWRTPRNFPTGHTVIHRRNPLTKF